MERRRIVQAFRHCRPSCGQRKDARPFGHAAGTGRRGGLARRGDVQGGDKRLGKGEGEREGERENRFSKRFPSPPRQKRPSPAVFGSFFVGVRDPL